MLKHTAYSELLLIMLTALGCALRLWGTGYGLPFLYHPDEPLGAQVALNMIKTGDLNPHFFGYGSLFFYLNAIAYLPYYLIGRAMGLFHVPTDIPDLQTLALGVGRTLMPSQIVLGRLVSVLAGSLCIPVAYWLGMRLSSRRTGLLAGAFVALSPTLVLHSQFITPNILATLMTLLMLAALMRLTSESRWLAYGVVGVAFGGAIASKYNAGLLIMPLGVTFLALHGRAALRRPETYLSLAVAGLAFLFVTPYAVLDFPKFLDDTRFHLTYYTTVRHAGMEGNTVGFYLQYVFVNGGLIAFLGLLPIVGYLKSRNWNGLVLTSFAIPYIVYISTLQLRNDRTILIVLPVVLVLAADFLHSVWRRVAMRDTFRFRPLALAILSVFVGASLVYLAWKSIELNIAQTTPDAREHSRQWIETNVAAEIRIAAESYSPFIDPERYDVSYFNTLIDNPLDWYVDQGYDLLVLSSGAFGRFYAMPDRYFAEIAQYDALLARFPEVAHFDQNGITIRILKVTG